jgi:uncharacterized RDD family membrane protein YckC
MSDQSVGSAETKTSVEAQGIVSPLPEPRLEEAIGEPVLAIQELGEGNPQPEPSEMPPASSVGETLAVAPGEAVQAAEPVVQGKSFAPRMWAYLIDVAIIWGVTFLTGLVVGGLAGLAAGIYGRIAGVSISFQKVPVLLNYSVGFIRFTLTSAVFTWLAGGSPGKWILKMRVVTERGERVGIGAALVRSVMLLVDSFFFAAVAYFNMKPPRFQRLGDKMAKTIVIKVKDPFLKRPYSRWGYYVSSAVFLAAVVLESLIYVIGTMSAIPLVKVPAAQLNLQLSDFPHPTKLVKESHNILADEKNVIDTNGRTFANGDLVTYSSVLIFNSKLKDTNASLQKFETTFIQNSTQDPEVEITPLSKYTDADETGWMEQFASTRQDTVGYCYIAVRKNVLMILMLSGPKGSVSFMEIDRLRTILLNNFLREPAATPEPPKPLSLFNADSYAWVP